MNDIVYTMSEELLAVPAQMHRTNEEHLALLTETYMGPLCKSCKGNCCSICAKSKGYLQYIRTRGQIDYLKKKYGWDKQTGFLTPTGCRLPRNKRSWICRTYVCSRAICNMPATVVDFIRQSAFWLEKPPHIRELQIAAYGTRHGEHA